MKQSALSIARELSYQFPHLYSGTGRSEGKITHRILYGNESISLKKRIEIESRYQGRVTFGCSQLIIYIAS